MSLGAALVTGGASGIGRAAAQLLAARGAQVVVADVDEDCGRETVALIERGGGAGATFRSLDVADSDAVAELFAELAEVQIVFNCAGLVSGQPDFPDTPPQRIAQLVAVNVLGTVLVTRASVLHMSSGGAIVNVASTAALLSDHADPVYGASKAAVKVFTEQCSRAALARGVRVNTVLPGAVNTPIIAKTGDGRTPADWLRPRLAQVELLTPETVAAVMLDLALDETRSGESVVIANPK